MAKDYYTVLGVRRGVSDKEIRQAYRRLARQYHPDVNLGDKRSEGKFKEINAAYEVLADPEKRQKYDRFGENWKHADQYSRGGGAAGRQSPFGPAHFYDVGVGSLFSELFGGRGTGTYRTTRSNVPVEVPLELSLEEAHSGVIRILQLPGTSHKRLEVKIPAGVDTGSRVHVPVGNGSDLYLLVRITSHRKFKRKGSNLYVDLSVSLMDALLGGEKEAETFRGKILLTIPPESQNGQVFKLKNQGMPILGDSDNTGDLYVSLRVVLPTGLSSDERQFFEDMRRSRDQKGGY